MVKRSPQALKKAKADAEYRLARQTRITRSHGLCEVRTEGCTIQATQTHHVIRRSQGVDHQVENLRSACLTCHTRIHQDVAWAKEYGWIVSSWPNISSLTPSRLPLVRTDD